MSLVRSQRGIQGKYNLLQIGLLSKYYVLILFDFLVVLAKAIMKISTWWGCFSYARQRPWGPRVKRGVPRLTSRQRCLHKCVTPPYALFCHGDVTARLLKKVKKCGWHPHKLNLCGGRFSLKIFKILKRISKNTEDSVPKIMQSSAPYVSPWNFLKIEKMMIFCPHGMKRPGISMHNLCTLSDRLFLHLFPCSCTTHLFNENYWDRFLSNHICKASLMPYFAFYGF